MDKKPTYEELERRIQELEKTESERKLMEQWKTLNIRILDTINRSETWKDCIEEVLGEIKQFAGFEAVAIRLLENEDFPYYVTKGFPPGFVEAERYLCTRDSKGEIIRDSEGNPYVECMCGNVICGRTDASMDFFTESGSFWSNNTSKLLSETTDEDRQSRTRNRCNSEGYESVALFPLKIGNEILGLLQINDTRFHQFTDDIIQYFEEIAISIGIAFSRKQMKDSLQKSEIKYRDLFESSLDGIAESTLEGKLLNCNSSYALMTGYSKKELKKLSYQDLTPLKWAEVDKKHVQQCLNRGYSDLYEKERLTKDGMIIPVSMRVWLRKDEQGKPLSLWGIVQDITERKKLEAQLLQSHKMESVGTLAGGINGIATN